MLKSSHWFVPSLVMVLALSACGKEESPQTVAPSQPAADATQPIEATKLAETAVADEAAAKGEKVYKNTCAMCHQTGAAGAPIAGNKEEWAPRIAQGTATLYDHAIVGFTGAKGMMPAKGGNPSLPDEDVKAAVDYMVNKSQ